MVCSLQRAFDSGRYRQAHVLLQVGRCNVNSRDIYGRTVLMKCALLGHSKEGQELARVLIEAGANKTIVDKEGRNALFYAAVVNNVPMARLLLTNLDIDLNATDNTGSTVLHLCCDRGLYKFCKLLVPYYRKYRVLIDVPDGSGKTPLHVACAGGCYDVARLLVYEGKASLQRCDDREFKNAREWLVHSQVVPLNIDPFPAVVELRKKWAMYAINRVQNKRMEPEKHACGSLRLNTSSPAKLLNHDDNKRRRHSTIPITPTLPVSCHLRSHSAANSTSKVSRSFECQGRAKTAIGTAKVKVEFKPLRTSTAKESKCSLYDRSKSAPSASHWMDSPACQKRMDESIHDQSEDVTLKTSWLEGVDTAGSRVLSADVRTRSSSCSFFSSNTFQEIFQLYSEQSSGSFRPSVVPPPDSVTCDQSLDDEHTDLPGNTKTRIQRFIRMRRAESILKSLKSFKGAGKSPTSPRRESAAALEFMKRQARSEPNGLVSDKNRRRSDFKPLLRGTYSSDVTADGGFSPRGRYASVDVNMVGFHQK